MQQAHPELRNESLGSGVLTVEFTSDRAEADDTGAVGWLPGLLASKERLYLALGCALGDAHLL
jgi:hypothetical protein